MKASPVPTVTFGCVTIEPISEIPIYRQLADILRAQIEAGELPPGGLVPSEQQLMGQHGIARDTVRAAIKVLRDEGLVVTAPGKGTFVRRR
jgi:DNA-binding GntR family transcriptional regulator